MIFEENNKNSKENYNKYLIYCWLPEMDFEKLA